MNNLINEFNQIIRWPKKRLEQDKIIKWLSEKFDYKKKYSEKDNVPRPDFWSGWNLNPHEIEFWLNGKDRIHQRLLYSRAGANEWQRYLLNP